MSIWEGLKDKIDYSWEHEKAKFRLMGNIDKTKAMPNIFPYSISSLYSLCFLGY